MRHYKVCGSHPLYMRHYKVRGSHPLYMRHYKVLPLLAYFLGGPIVGERGGAGVFMGAEFRGTHLYRP
jgi:hypothetical protein